jgi:hypothetical protein
VTHLVVAHLRGDGLEHTAARGEPGIGLQRAVTGQRADRDRVAFDAHVGQILQPADIDEHRRGREAKLHQRDERHAARDELGLVTVLGDQRDRLVGRLGPHVLEGRGNHRFDLAVSAAASTAFTMLW